MAGLLTRFTTFLPNTTILSNDHNQEFNRIVNLLNGTTTNLKGVLKTSDAGDPPLELDQLSTGPLLKLFQGGIEKARFRNDGALRTPGIYDANDNEELLFVATGSAVNEFTMTNAATGNRPALAATGGNTDIGITISPKGAGQIVLTGSSPLRLPTAAPTDDNDAARKLYVDDTKIAFSIDWFVADPSTFPGFGAETLPKVIVPDGTAMFARKVKISRAAGSHTASGVIAFAVQVRRASGSWGSLTSLGGAQFDDTNSAAHTVYTGDISDSELFAGDTLVVTTSGSGTISERDCSIALIGDQKRT